MPPGPDEAELWWIGPSTRYGDAGCLSGDERARADRMTDRQARADFLRHRAALRTVLAGHLGVPPGDVRFGYGPNGRPRCHGGPAFSLSHAGEWALIAVGGGEPLGVDVEHLVGRADLAGLARRFLSGLYPDLAADLERMPEEAREPVFLTAWTRYEATLKAAGGALGRRLPPESRRWAVRRLSAPRGYVATLVTGRPLTSLRCRLPARPGARDPDRRLPPRLSDTTVDP